MVMVIKMMMVMLNDYDDDNSGIKIINFECNHRQQQQHAITIIIIGLRNRQNEYDITTIMD